jgi:hypothetical protein
VTDAPCASQRSVRHAFSKPLPRVKPADWKADMPKTPTAKSSKSGSKPAAANDTSPLSLPAQLTTVRVSRPDNGMTIVNNVDDIDVRDGSLLLLKRGHGHETCMMVFSPAQWISVNVDPV